MAEYHVGCGIAGIYAGILNKKGDMWRNKTCVTKECLDASAQYLIQSGGFLEFKYNGKKYRMKVIEQSDAE